MKWIKFALKMFHVSTEAFLKPFRLPAYIFVLTKMEEFCGRNNFCGMNRVYS